MLAVAGLVAAKAAEREKVLLFCHHHATAQELTRVLAAAIPKHARSSAPRSHWEAAWRSVLPTESDGSAPYLQSVFVAWLSSPGIRAQVQGWLDGTPATPEELASALRSARRHPKAPTAAVAAAHLFRALVGSASTKAVLSEAGDGARALPGGERPTRVLGYCTPSEEPAEQHLFVHNKQPDTMIAIFNSPFGPDALSLPTSYRRALTIHRYCRHLVHYELDPSPIRTVQHNGATTSRTDGRQRLERNCSTLTQLSWHARSPARANHEETRRQFLDSARWSNGHRTRRDLGRLGALAECCYR